MQTFQRLFLALILVSIVSTLPAQSILYVDDDALPGGDGLAWSSAYPFLQDALAEASAPGSLVTEIRVAGGVYVPDRDALNPFGTSVRTVAFELVSGVALHGGYRGLAPGGSSDDRDFALFSSRLSGDLFGNDGVGGTAENSYHVCVAPNTAPGTVLEGFLISEGNGDGSSNFNKRGAGLHVADGSLEVSFCEVTSCQALIGGGIFVDNTADCVFNHCVVRDNHASFGGGGIAMLNSSPVLNFCVVEFNTSVTNNFNEGGGVWMDLGSPQFFDCSFRLNEARIGGAMYLEDGTTHMERCVFEDNFAHRTGGGVDSSVSTLSVIDCCFRGNAVGGVVFHGIGGAIRQYEGSLELESTVFIDNQASDIGAFSAAGGAVALRAGIPPAATIVRGCTFERNGSTQWSGALTVSGAGMVDVDSCRFLGNSSGLGGGAIRNDDNSTLTVTNCEFTGNTSSGSGGALHVATGAALSVTACTLTENSAAQAGAILHEFGTLELRGCVLWGNQAPAFSQVGPAVPQVARYSNAAEFLAGLGNISTDPLFVEPPDAGFDGVWGTVDDNFGDVRLANTSPCIDAADTTDLPPGLSLDLGGLARVIDDPATVDTGPLSPAIDMGAHEHPGSTAVFYVRGDCDPTGSVDIADAVRILNVLFAGGNLPSCELACEANGDMLFDIADSVFLLSFLFGSGAAPPAPFPLCVAAPSGPLPCVGAVCP